MSLVLNESVVLAKTRSQDLKSVLKLNCWGCGIKDVSLVRQLVNVEVIGLSCNEITTLEDFAYCHKLKELILRKNKIKNIAEVAHLQALPKLTSLWLGENPCAENTHNYRKVVLKALPSLTVLDNVPVTREELQEIEELGNEIYEEIPYESSNSSGSGPSSTANQSASSSGKTNQQQANEYETNDATPVPATLNDPVYSNEQQSFTPNDSNCFQPNESSHEVSATMSTYGGQQSCQLNDSHFSSSMLSRQSNNSSRASVIQQQSRCLSSQGSVTTLNGPFQGWSISNNNNNNNNSSSSNDNNILPKGGKSRNGNILSAVLCLVKELDYTSCEVVQTALHCRMEETSQ